MNAAITLVLRSCEHHDSWYLNCLVYCAARMVTENETVGLNEHGKSDIGKQLTLTGDQVMIARLVFFHAPEA